MNIPDFIGIGAPKCGTTWLSSCLQSHPSVFIPNVKEIVYFSSEKKLSRGVDWYINHFNNRLDSQVAGEFSVPYLNGGKDTARRIADLNPEMKIIAVLRNPIERTISHYRWLLQLGKIKENLDFDDVLDQNSELVDNSLYGTNLSYFCDIFGRNKILLIKYDSISNNPLDVLKKTFRFIGVDDSFKSKMFNKIIGKTITPKYIFLEKIRIALYQYVRRKNLSFFIRIVKSSGLSSFYRDFNDKKDFKKNINFRNSMIKDHFINDLNILQEKFDFNCEDWINSIKG